MLVFNMLHCHEKGRKGFQNGAINCALSASVVVSWEDVKNRRKRRPQGDCQNSVEILSVNCVKNFYPGQYFHVFPKLVFYQKKQELFLQFSFFPREKKAEKACLLALLGIPRIIWLGIQVGILCSHFASRSKHPQTIP